VNALLAAIETWMTEGGALMPILGGVGCVLYALLIRCAMSPPEAGGLTVVRALIGAAPLLGLLGTVNGIISSFDGLVEGGAVERMSEGIGNALRTTQYGLAIAAPALLGERILSRRAAAALARGTPDPVRPSPLEVEVTP
jgi:hypothetical protein